MSNSESVECAAPTQSKNLLQQAAEDELRRSELLDAVAKCTHRAFFKELAGRKGEDKVAIVPRFRGVDGSDYFAVFDGHRGKEVAALAASALHVELCELLRPHGDGTRGDRGDSNVSSALRDAFSQCHKHAQVQGLHDGATALVFITLEGVGWCANAGDSRAVLCREGKALRLSQDHKASDPDEFARIQAAGGLVKFGCINGMLAVSRGLGDLDFCSKGFSQEPFVASPVDLRDAGNQFLIMASDGVWDEVSDDVACELVHRMLQEESSLDDICTALLQKAERGRDDKSVILIDFRSAGVTE